MSITADDRDEIDRQITTTCDHCKRFGAVVVPQTWYDVTTRTAGVEGVGELHRWLLPGVEYTCGACGAKTTYSGPVQELDSLIEVADIHVTLSMKSATLSRTAWWILSEVLSGLGDEERAYFLDKCSKNDLDLASAQALAEVFGVRITDEQWAAYR